MNDKESPEPASALVRNLIVWLSVAIATLILFNEMDACRKRAIPPPNAADVAQPLPVSPIGNINNQPAPPETITTSETVFATVAPSVVVIYAIDEADRRFRQGSGVVISGNEVATARHVVERARGILVRQGTSEWPATVKYSDPGHDLCVLSVHSIPLPSITMASISTLKVGQRVYAVAAPRGLELSISDGLVSSLRPTGNTTYIQTSASVSPGSSGGGIFDSAGRLVGVISFTATEGQNLNFALPAELIQDLPERSTDINTLPPIASQEQFGGASGAGQSPRSSEPPLSDDPSRRYQREAIDALKRDIDAIQTDMRSRREKIDRLRFSIEQQQKTLEILRARRDVSGSNVVVVEIHRQIEELNGQVAEYKTIQAKEVDRVERANRMVAEFNGQR